MKSYIGNKGIKDVSFNLMVIEISDTVYVQNIKYELPPCKSRGSVIKCLKYNEEFSSVEWGEIKKELQVRIFGTEDIMGKLVLILFIMVLFGCSDKTSSEEKIVTDNDVTLNTATENYIITDTHENGVIISDDISLGTDIPPIIEEVIILDSEGLTISETENSVINEDKKVELIFPNDSILTENSTLNVEVPFDEGIFAEDGVIIPDDISLGTDIPPIIEEVIILDSEGFTISETENLVINEDKKVELILPHDSILTENSTLNVEVPFDEGNFTIESDVDVVDTIVDNELKLFWPINCEPGVSCSLGHADVDSNGVAFNCNEPGYVGHEGIDIALMSWSQMDAGVDVYAAQSGIVLWAFDHAGAHDKCTSESIEPECLPANTSYYSGMDNGYTVCTELGAYCPVDSGNTACYWCFNGKNVVVIKHDRGGVFATRYDHLKSGSLLVKKGDYVKRGDKIAEVGSAGNSTGPHLHFEVWGDDYYSLVEAFSGECGPNYTDSLWGIEGAPWKVRRNE